MSDRIGSDDGLLELAELVLDQAGYAVTSTERDGLRILIAEDVNNVVAATATLTPSDIPAAESVVGRLLVEQLAGSKASNKKWDGFLVLLCAQGADDEMTGSLAELVNNLRQVRRVIRVAVEPTLAGVARALRPLLPLPTPELGGRMGDPMVHLEDLLLRDGIESEAVQEVMLAFALSDDLSVLDSHPASLEVGDVAEQPEADDE